MTSQKQEPFAAAVTRQMHGSEVAPRSIVLFFALLAAFIAVLILREHRPAIAGSNSPAAAAATIPAALAAQVWSLPPAF
jgi:hypothetical protein